MNDIEILNKLEDIGRDFEIKISEEDLAFRLFLKEFNDE
jgi:hypothetical protein